MSSCGKGEVGNSRGQAEGKAEIADFLDGGGVTVGVRVDGSSCMEGPSRRCG